MNQSRASPPKQQQQLPSSTDHCNSSSNERKRARKSTPDHARTVARSNNTTSRPTPPTVISPIPSSPRPTKKICQTTTTSTTPCNNVIPSSFTCPLTMDVMLDPVLDTEGNSYERAAILQWLRQSRTSPLSRQPLTERMLIPNVALKSVIHETMGDVWVQEQQTAGDVTTSLAATTTTSTKQQQQRLFHNDFRAKIDCFLQHTCQQLGGLQLSLNDDGCCAFRYESITVVLDVPETVGVFCLYTKHLVDLPAENEMTNHRLCQTALALNFLQGDTRGGCLSIRSTAPNMKEIMFSYTDRVPEVSARDFSNILLNFVETSVVLREKLLRGIVRGCSPTVSTTTTASGTAR